MENDPLWWWDSCMTHSASSVHSGNQRKAGIPQKIRVTWTRKWRPWTSSPSAVPNTKTDHRLPGSSRGPNTATPYTGWLDLTLGPGSWQRNGTVAKRCLGSTLSRSQTLFTRKYPWRADKSWRTKWHRRYGRYTLLKRGLRVNLLRNPSNLRGSGMNTERRWTWWRKKSIESTGLFEHRLV